MSGSGNKHRHQDFHRGFSKGGLLTGTATDTGAVLAVGVNGTVLTADSTASTGLAWSAPSGGASSFGSNSNSVGSANAPGASSSNARADHVHQGVHRLTSNGSNALFEDVNVAAGSGIALGVSGQTVTITNTGSSGGGGGGTGTLTTIEELDGSPTSSAVTKLVLPNGTLGIVGTVATYTPTAGGSGMTNDGTATVWTPPGSANAMDDEFADGSGQSGPVNGLNAKWSKHNLGTSTWLKLDSSIAPGSLYFDIPTGQAADQAIYQAAPAGDFVFAVRVQLVDASDRQMWGLMALDTNGTGTSVHIDTGSVTAGRHITTWAQTGSAISLTLSNWQDDQTLVLRKASGVYYYAVITGNRIVNFTPDRISLTPTAFTVAYIAFGRTFGTGVGRIVLDTFRRWA